MSTDSVLGSVKGALGLPTEGFAKFDPDLIMHINSVFMTLNQIGVGPLEGFSIENDQQTWAQFIAGQPTNGKPFTINAVRSFMFIRVRLIFDPPQHGPTIESMTKTAEEYEWRLKVQAEEANR